MKIEDCIDCKWKLATNECLKNARKHPENPDLYLLYPCSIVCTTCTLFEKDNRRGVTNAR